jgi:hypothetical protein
MAANTFYSFGILNLIDVRYGIEPDDKELNWLAQQLATQISLELARNRGDERFMNGAAPLRPLGEFTRRLLTFCASHKSIDWSVEREVRIIALPINKVLIKPFRPTTPPLIETDSNTGKKYIMFGQNQSPAFRPKRIIIGPNAELDQNGVEELFPFTIRDNTPAVVKTQIKICEG